MITSYEQLANAIILLAVKDYRNSLKTIRRNPRSQTANDMKGQCERFFFSQWFQALTSVDGKKLAQDLQREVMA